MTRDDRDEAGCVDPVSRPAGLRVLVPGWPQWAWGQRERALVLFGSFAAAVGVGIFVWGTKASLAILAFAFAAHVASAADAIRQSAFPGFGRWVPMVSASAGLGLGCYGPAIGLGMVLAWPGYGGRDPGDGFLINRGAYWTDAPAPGDWAWVRLPSQPPRPIRVLAGPGQRVEWSASGLRVEGQGMRWQPPAGTWRPREIAFTVPEGQVLVALEPEDLRGSKESGNATSCGLLLVQQGQVEGRAWARLYPIWNRSLLN